MHSECKLRCWWFHNDYRERKTAHDPDSIPSGIMKRDEDRFAYWTKVVPKKRAFNRLTLSTRMPTVRMTKTSPMFWSKMISSAVRGCLLHSLHAQQSAPALLWRENATGTNTSSQSSGLRRISSMSRFMATMLSLHKSSPVLNRTKVQWLAEPTRFTSRFVFNGIPETYAI